MYDFQFKIIGKILDPNPQQEVPNDFTSPQLLIFRVNNSGEVGKVLGRLDLGELVVEIGLRRFRC